MIITDSSTTPTKKQKTDVTLKSSSRPSFIHEEIQLLRSINQQLYLQVGQLKQEVSYLVTENNKLKNELENTRQQVETCLDKAAGSLKDNLGGKFSCSQVESLITGKAISRWKVEDISIALAIRSLSTKTYNFLRKTMLPLPSVRTINRWVSKLAVEPGILESVLRLLKHKSETMTERDRLCTLSLDETSVCSQWTYDKATGKIYDPKQNVMCFMLQGLTSRWKQLVYYDFDVRVTKELLLKTIEQVEAAGFHIVAMVNDLAPTNIQLWNSLGISTKQTSFPNPAAPQRQVFVFADVPHLIKLVRNNLLDHGFQLTGDKRVNSDCLRELVYRSTKDLKPTHRLSAKHIEVQGVKRMNVRLAVQLLSETSAQALQYFGARELLTCNTWQETSNFISLVDSWFDLFNSGKPTDMKDSRNAFGMNLDKQTVILQEMKDTMQTMRVGDRKFLLPFQKGILISSTSLPELHRYLKQEYDMPYILTRRLNQDVLEHFFACLRQMGGTTDQHPSPVDVKHRIRSYLLGKDAGFFGSNCNSDTSSHDTSISVNSFTTGEAIQNGNENLHDELTLSAMVFSTCELSNSEDDTRDDNDLLTDFPENSTLEQEMEEQGLLYFGGYIVKKFPHYSFLGRNVELNDETWIGHICRKENKLMKPDEDFIRKLKEMEHCFNLYHGEKALKPEYNSMKKLSSYICSVVDLPNDVVFFFVKCRVFFRLRELNRRLRECRTKKNKKIKKLIQ